MRFITSIVSIDIEVLLTSCALKHRDVVEERGVTLDVRPEGDVSMASVAAYQEGEHLLVSGSIRQKKAIRPFSGWVQVTVLLENGEVFEERCESVAPQDSLGLRRQALTHTVPASFFDVTLPKVPPPGSVTRVVGSTQASLCTEPREGDGLQR